MAAFRRTATRAFSTAIPEAGKISKSAAKSLLRTSPKLPKKNPNSPPPPASPPPPPPAGETKQFDPAEVSKRMIRLLELKESMRVEVREIKNILKLPRDSPGLLCNEEMEKWYARKRSEELATLKNFVEQCLRDEGLAVASAVRRCEAKLDAFISKKEDRLLRKLSRFWYGPI